MKLRDIVAGKEYPKIMYRTNGPNGEDFYFGRCAYTNGKLKSLDGDYYSLDDEIDHFFVDDENNGELIVYIKSEWQSGKKNLKEGKM